MPPQGVLGRQLFEREVAPSGDDGQEVVEVVRDAARELPDRLHLLRLGQLPLRVLEIVVGGLELLGEPRLPEGDRELVADLPGHRQIRRGRSARLTGAEVEGADELALGDQRHDAIGSNAGGGQALGLWQGAE